MPYVHDRLPELSYYLILICTMIYCSSSYAQSYDYKMRAARGSSDTVQVQIKNLTSLEEEFESAPYDTIGHLHYFIAYRYFTLSDYDGIIRHADKAISNYLQSDYYGYRLPTSYLIKGKAAQDIGLIDEAIESYDSIINLKISGRGFESLYEAHLRKAEIYRTNGEFEAAINYLNSFIESSEFDSIDRYGKATLFRELSIDYSEYSSIENRMLSQKALDQADSIYSEVPIDHIDVLEQVVLNEMQKGFIATNQDRHQLAIDHYTESIKLMYDNRTHSDINNLYTISLINICNHLIDLNQCQAANSYINRADESFEHHENPRYIEASVGIKLGMANISSCMGEYKKSKSTFAAAKYELTQDSSIQDVIRFRNSAHKNLLIDVLIDEYITDTKFKHLTTLKQLQDGAYLIDSLIDFHLIDMYFEGSMQIAKGKYNDFYQAAIKIAMELDDHSFYWFLTEKLNNLLLLMNIHRNDSQDVKEEVSSINSKIKKLAIKASQLENELYFAKPDSTAIDIDSLQQVLIKNKSRQLEMLQSRDKYLQKNMIVVDNLSSVINAIDTNEILIAYHFSSDRLHALTIKNDVTQIFDLGKRSDILNELSNWRTAMTDSNNDRAARDSFTSTSHQLYALLIQPLGRLADNLTIIPDEELHYLNFETLLTNDRHYLIQSHTISYDLSGTLLMKNREPGQNPVTSIAAFRPNYQNSDLPELSNSKAGIKPISDIAGVTLYSDLETTKDNFIAALTSSDILHFGGHAIKVDENNKYSHLALSSSDTKERNIISLGDLYTLKSPTQLVALPACHSGSGKLIAGEGISNLSRGFFYAGAASVISSLWEANDKSNSIIMNSFYEYLIKGEAKSTALRLAKLDYLSNSPEYLRHPSLWGGLILTGDSQAMLFKQRHSYLIYGFIGLLLLLAVWIMLKRLTFESKQVGPH